MHKIPVTVLSGYLGAGKTTLLRHILQGNHGYKMAVIVNDMSEVNIDSQHVKQTKTDEKLVEMQNGCICCTLREDLLIEVRNIVAAGDIDYILIESSGISEPIPVAQTFTYEDVDTNIDLTQFCRLDTMVTVVDANRFWHDYGSGETLLERGEAIDETDVRDVVDLLIDQIEFADVIILNKIDLVDDEHVELLHNVLRQLNRNAKVIHSSHGQIDVGEILNTGRFDFDRASESAGWLKELNGEHTPETEEYGIHSFVFRADRPFHPERLNDWLENMPAEIVRAKGFIWLASRHDDMILLSQAGPSITFQPMGPWVAALSEAERAEILASEPLMRDKWHPQYGDRQVEFVIIGVELDESEVRAQLDDCLLTDEEMATSWQTFADPLPAFS